MKVALVLRPLLGFIGWPQCGPQSCPHPGPVSCQHRGRVLPFHVDQRVPCPAELAIALRSQAAEVPFDFQVEWSRELMVIVVGCNDCLETRDTGPYTVLSILVADQVCRLCPRHFL